MVRDALPQLVLPITKGPDFFYVLGALLGDGCAYFWRGQYQVWLIGNEAFATRYADRASRCLRRKVVAYYYRRRNYWFVKVNHQELFQFLKSTRKDHSSLADLIAVGNRIANSLALVQGFFDAEGCVKVINDSARTIPKICLDMTNTDLVLQELIKKILKEASGIEERMSCQIDPTGYRQPIYHSRIYRKSDVKRFLELIPTTKMTKEKAIKTTRWLERQNWRKKVVGEGSESSNVWKLC